MKTKTATFQPYNSKDEPMGGTVKGKIIPYAECPTHTFVLHKAPDRNGELRYWHVSEVTTGAYIAHETTRKATLDAAAERMARYGAQVPKLVADVLARRKVAP